MSALIDGKVVVSHHLPPLPNDGHSLVPSTVKQIQYLAFTTRFDGKTVFTGIGIGRVDPKKGLQTTETANGVAKTIAKAEGFKGNLIVCECRNSETAERRTIEALKAAKDGDGLLIVCKDSDIYDDLQIFQLLGVERG
jgi:hypothetical protein